MRGMPQALYFLASIGNLALALFVVFRARRARGALPIALLCLSLFVWDIAEAAKVDDDPEGYWQYIRLIGSSMAPAFLWNFVLVFAHRETRLRASLVLLYAVTAAFTLSTAGALVWEPLRAWVDGIAWNVAYLVALFPFLVFSFIVIRGRAAEVESPVERNAINLVALGIAVGLLTGLTDLVHKLSDGKIPQLGHVGSILCAVLLAIAILRHRILEEQAPVRKLAVAFFLVLSAAFVLVVLNRRVPGRWDAYLLTAATVSILTYALTRRLYTRIQDEVARRRHLAMIGTMAAGIAHEVKNPLAAIKGAAQFIQKDLEGRDGLADAKDYLGLLVGEVDRLNGVVESFLSYARPLDPKRQDVPVDSFLADLLRLQAASFPANVKLETALDPELPPAWADPSLLTMAVTNVVRNGVEAMGEKGGTLSVRTRATASALRSYVAIEVADTGPGIPPEERERVFEPFHTTKARGTGLGLAIVQRIVEAHGGEILVEDAAPSGCRITLLIPVRSL